MTEFKVGDERKNAADETMNAYKASQDIVAAYLVPTYPIRLGLALNFSVFYYEILNESDNACSMAKQVGLLVYLLVNRIGQLCKLIRRAHLTEAARRSSNSQFHGEGEKRKEMEKYFGNTYKGDPSVPHADVDRFTNIWIGCFAFSALTWVNLYMRQLSNQMKTYGGYSWPAIQICSTFEACKWIFQEDVGNGQAACPWENVSST